MPRNIDAESNKKTVNLSVENYPLTQDIEAEINKRTIDIPIEMQSLTQDIEVNFASSIIYAFSPTATIEELQNGNYLITITDKNGTTTCEIPIIQEETIGALINDYVQQHPIFLHSISIAGLPITLVKNSITEEELKNALGLAGAAYKDVDSSIVSGSTSQNLPTSQAVAQYIAAAAQKVTSSEINGNIRINNVETKVYTLPSSVVDQNDILILNGGNASSTYT